MIKNILLTLLLLFTSLYAYDTRLDNYPETKEWLKDSDTNGESAYNIGVIYHQYIKDDTKAIKWFKKAYRMKDEESSGSAASNIAYIYEHEKKYDLAVSWNKKAIEKNDKVAIINLGLLYKKAYNMGDIKGAHGLALLYEESLKNQSEAIKWYKKAAKGGYADSIKNLARYYKLDKNDNITGGAYFLALIDLKYPKQKVITYLKTKWKLTDKELKEAYQLQKTLDIPNHYYDPELEDTPPKKKTGRR